MTMEQEFIEEFVRYFEEEDEDPFEFDAVEIEEVEDEEEDYWEDPA